VEAATGECTRYFDVLVILAGFTGIENQGEVISKQWMDVAWRIFPVRGYAVKRSLEVLTSGGPGATGDESNRDVDRHILPEILPGGFGEI
jgi:AP-3 complex subunit delta-1